MHADELVAVGDLDGVVPRGEHDWPTTVHARDREGHGNVAVDLSDHSQRVTLGEAAGIGLSSRQK